MIKRSALRGLFEDVKRSIPWAGDYLFRAFHRGLLRTGRRRLAGRGNVVRLHRSAVLKGVKFDVAGSANAIHVEPECILRNLTFYIRGDNNVIRLGSGIRFNLGGSLWIENNGNCIEIGAGSTFEDAHLAVTGGGRKIKIGEGCMLAYDIDIRTGDSHAIVDLGGNKINHERDVAIGDRVWVAAHCSVLKGSVIRSDSIVATRSTVTRAFDVGNAVIGGSPAAIIKTGVAWDRQRFPSPLAGASAQVRVP